jgi:hypothetical protein
MNSQENGSKTNNTISNCLNKRLIILKTTIAIQIVSMPFNQTRPCSGDSKNERIIGNNGG